MDGDVLLSWRLQNIVFIAAVVIGLVFVSGVIGQLVQRFNSE